MNKTYLRINRNAFKIAAIYAFVSILWILLSDRLLNSLPFDKQTLYWLSIIKGWGFVILTALLLYALTRKFFIDSSNAMQKQIAIEERWRFALDRAGDGLWDWRLNEKIYDYAGNWSNLLEQCGGINNKVETWLNIVHTDDVTELQKAINDHIDGLTDKFECEHRVKCPGHKTQWLLAKGLATERDSKGVATRFSGVVIDITKQKETEHELRIAATAFDSNEAKMITGTDKKIVRVNRAFSSITGYSQNEVIGQDPSILKSGRQSADFYREMWRNIHEKGYWQGEIWNKRKNGQEFPEWLRINVVKDERGNVTNYIASFNDVSDLKQARRQIDHLSHYDALTHLPNKSSMMSMLKEIIDSANHSSKYAALMFVDLKNFKTLNSAMGHNIGDVILEEFSSRLAMTSQHISVARYGGDVFAILANNIGNDTDDAAYNAHHLAELLVTRSAEPILVNDFQYRPEIRVGITVFQPRVTTSNEILKQVEMAIYESKTLDTAQIAFFNENMQSRVENRFKLEARLREAIPDQLFLTYQMQINEKNTPTGAEVLIRWQDPDEGIISPADFIPIAEKTGLINQIGDWVIKIACQRLAIWSSKPEFENLTLSVNVSLKQFMQPDFIEKIQCEITESSIQPNRLKLELTESIFVEDYNIIIDKMAKIKALGIIISLDDFGTGFSSLSYLKRLPIDELKIDQSFVSDLITSTESEAIVESIIRLGQSLNMNVIAEGVETEAQKEKLMEMNCKKFQGYLFTKPLQAEDIESLITKWK